MSLAGWTEVALGDICEFRYGKSLPQDRRSGGSVPVYGSNGVVGQHNVALTDGPAIIIGRKGSFGEIAFSRDPCWPIDTTYFIDRSATTADLAWLTYRLRGLHLTELNSAAAVPGLNRQDAYRQRLLLPPPEAQERIAQVLDVAESLLKVRRLSISFLDALKRAIFLELFGDPASNPKGWPVMSLGDLAAKFSDGPFGSNLKTSHYTSSGVRVIRLQNVGVDEFIDTDKAFVSESHFAQLSKHECLPGDVLIGTLGDPNLRACIQPSWLPRALNKADCVQLRPNDRLATADFLCALLNEPSTGNMASALIRGQTRLRISMGRLRHLLVPVPPLAIQDQFSARAAAVEAIRTAAHAALSASDALFASLQQRAYSGEL